MKIILLDCQNNYVRRSNCWNFLQHWHLHLSVLYYYYLMVFNKIIFRSVSSFYRYFSKTFFSAILK